MPQDDLMRRLALETLVAATRSLDGPAAEALAEAVGRRLSEACAADERSAAARLLAEGPSPLEPALAEALGRGLGARLAEAPGEAPAERPVPPWAAPPATLRDLARAARRAAHDLNQPLTVILGYAAMLKRNGDEGLCAEAAERIVQEARKMNEIIAGLSRVARSLDAA